jgi:deaminated glutathione amidase
VSKAPKPKLEMKLGPEKRPGKNSVKNPELRLAVVQMTSGIDPAQNVKTIVKTIRSLSTENDIISFPENCLFMRGSDKDIIPKFDFKQSLFDSLREAAVQSRAHLHLGSVPIRWPEPEPEPESESGPESTSWSKPESEISDGAASASGALQKVASEVRALNDRNRDMNLTMGGRLSNATVWIDPSGDIKIKYRKIHLFDVDVEGQKPIRESDHFAPGYRPEIIEIGGWRIGLTICYDLRFADLFLAYAREAVDLVLVPSAFLVPTGRAHWETLLRARAIESQLYVAAAAQSGEHASAIGDAKRYTYGRSLVVDPWGGIMAEAKTEASGVQVLTSLLRQSELAKVRAQIPMASHRKSDLLRSIAESL